MAKCGGSGGPLRFPWTHVKKIALFTNLFWESIHRKVWKSTSKWWEILMADFFSKLPRRCKRKSFLYKKIYIFGGGERVISHRATSLRIARCKSTERIFSSPKWQDPWTFGGGPDVSWPENPPRKIPPKRRVLVMKTRKNRMSLRRFCYPCIFNFGMFMIHTRETHKFLRFFKVELPFSQSSSVPVFIKCSGATVIYSSNFPAAVFQQKDLHSGKLR